MRIWHEKLIPILCQKHLCAVWREGLGCYKIITENKKGYRNHPATKEFEHSPVSLRHRLGLVREEMLKRGYHPKEFDSLPIFIGKEPAPIEWQTLEEQISVLKAKGCKCNVNAL